MAERQSWPLVQRILDYRNAKTIKQLFNGGSEGRERLMQEPALVQLLLDMKRAQQPGISLEAVLYALQHGPDEDED